uniref:Uncharacterized protein n=1 Tax=Arundo donax TaxID=35708 RepID=A0A0A8YMS6_ARUDO
MLYFNKVQHAYSNRKVSDTGHSRESYYCEMRSTHHTAGALLTQKRGLQDSVQINHASDTISRLSLPGV